MPRFLTPEVLEQLRTAEKGFSVLHSINDNDVITFTREVFEVCTSGVLSEEKCAQALSNCGMNATVIQPAILDVLWVSYLGIVPDLERDATGTLNMEVPPLQRLRQLVRSLLGLGLLDQGALMASQEVDLLHFLGILIGEAFRKKERLYYTRTYYTQERYSLLREDSEGWAFFLELLHAAKGLTATLTGAEGAALLAQLRRRFTVLVGAYSLDPNRALDLVMEAIEDAPDNQGLYELIPEGKMSVLHHILGSKFHMMRRLEEDAAKEATAAAAAPTGPPSSAKDSPAPGAGRDREATGGLSAGTAGNTLALCRIAANLLTRGFCSVEEIYPYLGPDDDLLRHGFAQGTKQLEKDAADPGSEGGSGLFNEFEPKLDPAELTRSFLRAMAEAKLTLPVVNGGADGKKSETRSCGPPDRWSKVTLLAVLLESGREDLAETLRAFLEAQDLNVYLFPSVARAYCKQLRALLEPAHSALFLDPQQGPRGASFLEGPEGALPDPSSIPAEARLPPEVQDRLLEMAGHIHVDPALFSMVCRVLRATLLRESQPYLRSSLFLSQRKALDAEELARSKAAFEGVARVVVEVLLPALAMTTGNQAMVYSLWEVLSVMPYTLRWELYIRAKDIGTDADPSPFLRAARRRVDKLARRMLKRSIMPESESDRRLVFLPRAMQFAKISHAFPAPAVVQMLNSVESYGNQAEIFADMFRHLSPYSQDVACMAVMRRLVNPEQVDRKLSSDGINPALWLQNLARFVGLICRASASEVRSSAAASPDVTPRPFLQLIANAFKDLDYRAQEQDLLVLREVLTCMSGQLSLPPYEMGDRHVEACAGGPLLRDEVLGGAALDSKARKENEACLRVLLQALVEGPPNESLAVPLLILLSQRKQHILTMAQYNDNELKVLGDRYDRNHLALLQLAEVLQRHGDRLLRAFTEPRRLLPSIKELVQDYGLEPEEVFLLHRPALSQCAPPEPQAEEGELEDEGAEGRRLQEKAAERYLEALERMGDFNTEGKLFRRMTREFYLCFWSLSLADVFVPEAQYKATLKELEDRVQALRLQGQVTVKGTVIDRRERDFYERKIRALKQEMEAQRRHVKGMLERVEREKGAWFDSGRFLPPLHSEEGESDASGVTRGISSQMMETLLRECIFPRCAFSAADALYCAKFFENLLFRPPRGFPNLIFLNETVVAVLNALKTRTEAESKCFAIFLREILRIIHRWYYNEQTFNAESGTVSGVRTAAASEGGVQDRWAKFRKAIDRLFTRPILAFATSTFKSEDYHELSNGLMVLFEIKDIWPLPEHLDNGDLVVDAARALFAKESGEGGKQDVALRVQRYLNEMEKRFPSAIPDATLVAPTPAQDKGKTEDKDKDRERDKVGNGPPSARGERPERDPSRRDREKEREAKEPPKETPKDKDRVDRAVRDRLDAGKVGAVPAVPVQSSADARGRDREPRGAKDGKEPGPGEREKEVRPAPLAAASDKDQDRARPPTQPSATKGDPAPGSKRPREEAVMPPPPLPRSDREKEREREREKDKERGGRDDRKGGSGAGVGKDDIFAAKKPRTESEVSTPGGGTETGRRTGNPILPPELRRSLGAMAGTGMGPSLGGGSRPPLEPAVRNTGGAVTKGAGNGAMSPPHETDSDDMPPTSGGDQQQQKGVDGKGVGTGDRGGQTNKRGRSRSRSPRGDRGKRSKKSKKDRSGRKRSRSR